MAGLSEANVKQFSSNVYHLISQKGSKFLGMISQRDVSKEEGFFEKVGYSTAQERYDTISDVNYGEMSHAKRSITWRTWYHAILINDIAKMKTMISPESEYSIEMKNAMYRKMDDIIIDGILGTTRGGIDGGTANNLGVANKRAARDAAATTNMSMTVETLRDIRRYFRENDNDDEAVNLTLSAKGSDDLLGLQELTSADYNSVKALVDGDVNTFMGINFVKSQRIKTLTYAGTEDDHYLNTNTGAFATATGAGLTEFDAGVYRRCFAWQKSGFFYTMPDGLSTRVDQLPQKHHINQLYCTMKMGIARMEEEKVLELFVKEDTAQNPIDIRVGTGAIN